MILLQRVRASQLDFRILWQGGSARRKSCGRRGVSHARGRQKPEFKLRLVSLPGGGTMIGRQWEGDARRGIAVGASRRVVERIAMGVFEQFPLLTVFVIVIVASVLISIMRERRGRA